VVDQIHAWAAPVAKKAAAKVAVAVAQSAQAAIESSSGKDWAIAGGFFTALGLGWPAGPPGKMRANAIVVDLFLLSICMTQQLQQRFPYTQKISAAA
jgi:hypothetical protein